MTLRLPRTITGLVDPVRTDAAPLLPLSCPSGPQGGTSSPDYGPYMTTTQPAHGYHTHLLWQGSTAAGYRAYPRQHRAVAPPAAEIHRSADPHFRGDAGFMNPEQLLVMAASSCQLLSFLALAARRGVDVLGYEDEAHGEMPEGDPRMRLTRITLTPVVTVAAGTDRLFVEELVHEAHDDCYISNSLTSQIILEPTVVTA